MQIGLEHILFWMDAIRNSDDPKRTLESFWKGQIHSKEWLVKKLGVFVGKPVTIDIFGGWNGVLAAATRMARACPLASWCPPDPASPGPASFFLH